MSIQKMRCHNQGVSLKWISLGFIFFLLTSCQPVVDELDPIVRYSPPKKYIEHLPKAAFPELSDLDLRQAWGKELLIGLSFAREHDFYRAITALKRALVLLPETLVQRELQINYEMMLCYYLANKYTEAIETFEDSRLFQAAQDFPAFQELTVMLYDCYEKTNQPDKACSVLNLIHQEDSAEAQTLELSTALSHADFAAISLLSCGLPAEASVNLFLADYQQQAKSVRTARALNAFLPGAGYLYVGQKKSALTSFLLNSLFIAAAYQFFDRGNIAAGIITTSFELGWYIGGINGAGIEASQYNHYLYQTEAEKMMTKEGLFPILRFEAAF